MNNIYSGFILFFQLIQEMKDASENGVGSPHSSQSYGSEERVISPPLHSTPTLKALTPGLGQCDIITKEVCFIYFFNLFHFFDIYIWIYRHRSRYLFNSFQKSNFSKCIDRIRTSLRNKLFSKPICLMGYLHFQNLV